MICPRCNGDLPSLMNPCPKCGLAFRDSRAVCRKCGIPWLQHIPTCPTKSEVVPCPLCGGKRHRKMPGSVYECAWRQWENQLGAAQDHNAVTERNFLEWREKHPQLMAGSVHAERLIRQAKRAKLTEGM